MASGRWRTVLGQGGSAGTWRCFGCDLPHPWFFWLDFPRLFPLDLTCAVANFLSSCSHRKQRWQANIFQSTMGHYLPFYQDWSFESDLYFFIFLKCFLVDPSRLLKKLVWNASQDPAMYPYLHLRNSVFQNLSVCLSLKGAREKRGKKQLSFLFLLGMDMFCSNLEFNLKAIYSVIFVWCNVITC